MFQISFAKTLNGQCRDSLTLGPHAQNKGPTTQVSRQVYEALVTRGLDMSIGPQLLQMESSWSKHLVLFLKRRCEVF